MPDTASAPSPSEILKNWRGIEDGNLQRTIRNAFGLPEDDDYLYRAEQFGMTLAQIQGRLDEKPLRYTYSLAHKTIEIPQSDIDAYTQLFSPKTDTLKALTSFLANAKRSSPRENVATYLTTRRLDNTLPSPIPKSKSHRNPYYDVWVYSCNVTGFVGPLSIAEYADPSAAKMTHPMLPVLYHHFGCVCPSWEAISVIGLLLKSGGTSAKGVLDMASGNGYWTFMLRNAGLDVLAVDNMESEWRYTWVPDTIKANGVEYLRKNKGAEDRVLLMVYMVTKGSFTRDLLRAYKGDMVIVVGTQNANRYTGFSDVGVEEWFQREMGGWALTVRIALPSFAGKDEALFVFQKGTK